MSYTVLINKESKAYQRAVRENNILYRVPGYRPITEMTDDEVEFIATDIFDGFKLKGIKRDKKAQEITVTMTSEWDIGCDKEESLITDEIVFSENDIEFDFSATGNELTKWHQFLIAHGYSSIWKDNPYVRKEVVYKLQ